jgi:hypothetical protein
MVEPFDHISNFDLHGRDTTRFKDPAQAMEGMPVFSHFRGLLRCCRTIYAEAAAILYSSNRFFIYYSGPGSLKPLHALTPTALASLARLKVIVNQASCHDLASYRDGYWCCYNFMCIDGYDGSSTTHCNASWDIGKHHHPLASCPPSHHEGEWRMAQTVLDEWQAAVTHISTHITAGKVQLSLVCDIDDEQTDAIDVAKRAVAPLTNPSAAKGMLRPALRNSHSSVPAVGPRRSSASLPLGEAIQQPSSHPDNLRDPAT